MYIEDRIIFGWERLKDFISRILSSDYSSEDAEFDSFLDRLNFAQTGEAPDYLTGWTPMDRRPPYRPGKYLITTQKGWVRINEWYGDKWRTTEKVIAWMPLPKAYKEEI